MATHASRSIGVNAPSDPEICRSTDQGVTWQFVTKPAVDPTSTVRHMYETLLQLPSGQLQCYFVHCSLNREFGVSC